MTKVSIKQLLEAGVHFGHLTTKWNPKMAKYIFSSRNNIHILDLQKTVVKIKEACGFVRDLAANNRTILFIGTKKQARDVIVSEAKRCGMFYVAERWWGGMLTNFSTIQKSISHLKELDSLKNGGGSSNRTKKELSRVEKERRRLERGLSGIKDMESLPGAVFIIDPLGESTAVAEANKLEIPVVALVDTDCNPDKIDYVIPGNDDAVRAVTLITSIIANAVMEGKASIEKQQDTEESEEDKESKEISQNE